MSRKDENLLLLTELIAIFGIVYVAPGALGKGIVFVLIMIIIMIETN